MLTAPIRVDLVGLPDVIRLCHAADELLTVAADHAMPEQNASLVPAIQLQNLADAYEQLMGVPRAE